MMKYFFLYLVLICATASAIGQAKPKKPYLLHEEADREFGQGDPQKALELVNECIKNSPGFMEAYRLRGAIREHLRQYDAALTDFSIFLEAFPTHPEALMSRAVLHYKTEHYDLAEIDLRKLLSVRSGETNAIFFRENMTVNDKTPLMTMSHAAHHPLVYQYLGLIQMKAGNYSKALFFLDSAIILNGREADFYVTRGNIKEVMHDSTAIIDYEIALKLNPQHATAQHYFEKALERSGKSISAEDRLSRTIEMDSSLLYPYLERGQKRYERGDYHGALADYNLALKRDEKDPEIWLARGLAREKLQDLTGAFSDYTKAIDLRESFARAWVNRGNVLMKQKRFEDAIDDYTVSLIYYPDNGAAFYNRGLARIQLKMTSEACADFDQAEQLGIRIDPALRPKFCK